MLLSLKIVSNDDVFSIFVAYSYNVQSYIFKVIAFVAQDSVYG